ncbi:MAG: MBL fold metallo-hydrolase [Eubacteriales bacterium]|nr:MBL fold metallo-hydrolase [Eubacteriales bacterium]
MGKLKFTSKVLGSVMTNVYLGENSETGEAFLIDPADRADVIEAWIAEQGVKLTAILLTHGHFDHIGAVNELKKKYQAKVYAMEEERVILEDPALNLSGGWGASSVSVKTDVLLKDGQKLVIAGMPVTAYHTPGHTKGGACYYFSEDGVLFSGDTIFCESVGRADLPTASARALVKSVQRMIELLPEETRVFPGHDMETTIAHEKMYNPYI